MAAAAPDVWRELERVARATGERFHPELVATAPEPVRRYFTAAVAPGTQLASGALLTMRGRIKIGRWLPFRARQVLVPRHGTVWSARVAGVIVGSDRYASGAGGMDWKLPGLLRVVRAEGPDVSRSAAERAAGESLWAPTALLPGPDVRWRAVDDQRVSVEVAVDDHRVTLHHELDEGGRPRTSRFDRWGDPDGTKTWGLRPFGVEVTDHRTFAGVTIPAQGRAGWHFGTDRWEDGAFFEFEITSYEPIG
jgi:hypothetical protein